MSSMPPPTCCATAKTRHLKDLGHLYQFDFDLFECSECKTYWVWAWREGTGGWEKVTPEDAQTMLKLIDPELRVFMKTWAEPFH